MADDEKLVNRKHYRPTTPLHKPLAIRRSSILDGTIKTYYGPGQTDNLDHYNEEYVRPSRWLPRGSSLINPQVVYLSVRSRTYAWVVNTTFEITQEDDTVPYHMFYYTDCDGAWQEMIIQMAGVWRAYRKASYWIMHNIFPDEISRIKDVYNSVKSQIEDSRKGKTFVDIVDWEDYESGPWGEGQIDEVHPKLFPEDITGYLLSPPPDVEYYGTNFLHIYAGHPQGSMEIPSPEFDLTVESVKRAYQNFAGYGALVFPFRYDGVGLDWRSATIETRPSDMPKQEVYGTFDFIPRTYGRLDYELCPRKYGDGISDIGVMNIHWTPGEDEPNVDLRPKIIADYASADAGKIESSYNAENDIEERNGQDTKILCDELSDYGVEFGGVTADITEGLLIDKISEFFKF